MFKAKRAVERYLQSSGLDYTILRLSGLASNLLPLEERFRETGFYLLIGDSKNCTSIISTDDLERIYNFQLETLETFLRRYLAI